MVDPINLLGALALGFIYGIIAFFTKRDKSVDEPFKIKKLLRTIAMFEVAAVVIALGGGSVGMNNLEAQVSGAGIVGVLFDHIWSFLRREGHLPEWMTGKVGG